MTDRSALVTAALSAVPLVNLAAYTTSQLREAALEAEPRLMAQMLEADSLSDEQKLAWFDHVRALNVITAEVQRRLARDAELGPHLVTHEVGLDGFAGHRLTNALMCF